MSAEFQLCIRLQSFRFSFSWFQYSAQRVEVEDGSCSNFVKVPIFLIMKHVYKSVGCDRG